MAAASLYPTRTIVYAVFLSLFVFFGMIGNLVSIFVNVILKEYQKSVTHRYVLQLSVANIFFLLTIPLKILERLRDSWTYSEAWCKANQTIIYLNYYASIFFLMIMSIDRYIAVCRPKSSRLQLFRKKTSALIISICLWAIAFLLCIPVMLYSFKVGLSPLCRCTFEFAEPVKSGSDYDYCNEQFSNQTDGYETCLKKTFREILESNEKHCLRINIPEENNLFSEVYNYMNYEDFDSYLNAILKKTNNNTNDSTPTENKKSSTCYFNSNSQLWFGVIMFNCLVMFVLPALVMIACYGLIVRRLFQTRMTRRQGLSFKRKRKLSERLDTHRIRVTLMCAILVVSFLVLWLPFHTNQVGKWIGMPLSTEDCQIFDIVSLIFAYMSGAVYPYLYAFLGSQFTRRFASARTTFHQSFSKRKRSSVSSSTINQLNRKNTSTNHTCVSKLNRRETNPRIYPATVDTTDTLNKKTTHSQCENSSPEY